MRISTTLASVAAFLLLSGSAMAEQGMKSTGDDIKQLEQDKKVDSTNPVREQTGRSADQPATDKPLTYDQQEQHRLKALEGVDPRAR